MAFRRMSRTVAAVSLAACFHLCLWRRSLASAEAGMRSEVGAVFGVLRWATAAKGARNRAFQRTCRADPQPRLCVLKRTGCTLTGLSFLSGCSFLFRRRIYVRRRFPTSFVKSRRFRWGGKASLSSLYSHCCFSGPKDKPSFVARSVRPRHHACRSMTERADRS